ncbi:hypothetical protein C8R45DRAFT_935308 [Mycena sanguinolenta]|nr:hypothetical protein C8R45DRAFT_935308 [Mycena sanguinolenta]
MNQSAAHQRLSVDAPDCCTLTTLSVPDSSVALSLLTKLGKSDISEGISDPPSVHRHSIKCNLTELHISRERRRQISRTRTPTQPLSFTLQRVTSLSVTLELAENFLAPKDALPQLQSLSVRWRTCSGLNPLSLFISLSTIATNLQMYPSIPWLSLDIEAHRCWFTTEDISTLTGLIMREDILIGRKLVRSLTLRLGVETHDVPSMALLAGWFPDICLFALVASSKTILKSAITPLLRTVTPTQWLKEMKINGEFYPLGEGA